jgi:hypothetical protein
LLNGTKSPLISFSQLLIAFGLLLQALSNLVQSLCAWEKVERFVKKEPPEHLSIVAQRSNSSLLSSGSLMQRFVETLTAHVEDLTGWFKFALNANNFLG